MRSVLDELREDERKALSAMKPAGRIAMALLLGVRDLQTFRLAHDPPLDVEEARRRLRLQRQQGRRPSRCVQEPND